LDIYNVEMHNHLNLIVLFIFFWLCLLLNIKLTSSGRLVDRLPYPYGWVGTVQ